MLSLPKDVLTLVEERKITAGHAKILVGLENASFIANKIYQKKFSVRQAENFVKIFKKTKKIKNTKDSNIKDLEDNLISKIGLNVRIQNRKNNKGTILFEYKDLDQLNKIIEILKNYY